MEKHIKYFIITLTILGGCMSSIEKNDSSIKKAISEINGEPVIPRTANKIHISMFRNFTNVKDLSEKLYVKLKDQLNMDGRLAVVPENKVLTPDGMSVLPDHLVLCKDEIPENIDADLRLDGVITGYEVQPVKFGDLGEPVRKRLRITASLNLIDLNKKKEIFFERSIQAFDEFSDKIPPITTEIKAKNRVIDILAERIALKTVNGWYTKLMTPVEKGKK